MAPQPTTPHRPTPLPKGIYTPIPTFFTPSEDLDLAALSQHIKFTTSANTIPVLSGSMGESPHLTPSDRTALIRTTRTTLLDIGRGDVPIVAGVGAASTRETVQLAKEAVEAGASFVLVVAPGYYAGVLVKDGGEALRGFFVDVAKGVEELGLGVGVVVYNFPAVAGGVDLGSEVILNVVREVGNVVGVKLTCASVGKITRITAVAHSEDFMARYPRTNPGQRFEVIDGFIDILLPSVAVGSAGAISGLPNFAPRTCVRLWQLCQAESGTKEYAEAKRLQGVIALADGVAAGVGISGMKQILHRRFGYGKNPRRPLLPMSEEAADELMKNEYLQALMAEEEKLGG